MKKEKYSGDITHLDNLQENFIQLLPCDADENIQYIILLAKAGLRAACHKNMYYLLNREAKLKIILYNHLTNHLFIIIMFSYLLRYYTIHRSVD